MSDVDDGLDRLVQLLAAKGSPAGRLRAAIYAALLSADTKLSPDAQALVFAEFAARLALAGGMSLEDLQRLIAEAYVDAHALLAAARPATRE